MTDQKKIRPGNFLLFTGLAVFMTMFTVVSVMGNIASMAIDRPSGIVFIVSSIMIILGLFL